MFYYLLTLSKIFIVLSHQAGALEAAFGDTQACLNALQPFELSLYHPLSSQPRFYFKGTVLHSISSPNFFTS